MSPNCQCRKSSVSSVLFIFALELQEVPLSRMHPNALANLLMPSWMLENDGKGTESTSLRSDWCWSSYLVWRARKIDHDWPISSHSPEHNTFSIQLSPVLFSDCPIFFHPKNPETLQLLQDLHGGLLEVPCQSSVLGQDHLLVPNHLGVSALRTRQSYSGVGWLFGWPNSTLGWMQMG